MIPEISMAERIQAFEMDRNAQRYQQNLIRAIGIQARIRGKDYTPSLSQCLASVMDWRQRYQAASESERCSLAMYWDWLDKVGGAMAVYDDWFDSRVQDALWQKFVRWNEQFQAWLAQHERKAG